MTFLVVASFVAGLVTGACAMRLRLHYQLLAEQERARRHSRIAWLVASKALQQLGPSPARTGNGRRRIGLLRRHGD